MRKTMLVRGLIVLNSLVLFAATQAQVTAVRLNELLADNASYTNADGSAPDLLEMYNTGASAADLTGSVLFYTNAVITNFVFQPGTVIPAQGFHRFTFDPNRPASTSNINFSIKASGGGIAFYAGGGAVLVDSIAFGLQIVDYSIGRVADGTGPWVLTVPTFGAANIEFTNWGRHSAVRLNEWLSEQNNSGPKDFIELYNTTNKPVNLSGTFLSDNVSSPKKFPIPNLSFIGTGWISGFLRFTADSSALNSYPSDHVNFSLGNSDSLGLYETNTSPNGFPIDFLGANAAEYGVHTNNVSRGRLPDGSTNLFYFVKINDYDTYSPGEPNFVLFTNLYINELLSHTDPPKEDAVEFQNRSATSLNIGGWWLSNSRSNRKRYRVPANTVITANGFKVIYEGVGAADGFNSIAALSPFTFNSARGDNVVLSQVDTNGVLTGYIAYETFEPAANGVSFGHYDTSVTNDYKFVAMTATSFGVDDPLNIPEFRTGAGKTNPFPRVGPIVLNEIMFAPATNTYLNTNGQPITGQNPAEEYIELRNISLTNVLMYDPLYPTNQWRLQTAVTYTFPLTNMPPNGFVLIVGFDPTTNHTALTNFMNRYNVASNVPILGPWTGRLSDAGDSIELYRPDPPQLPPHPDAGLVPYIRTDKVNYKVDSGLWPGGANQTGKSLQRKNSSLFGNDPINWAADVPNAGLVSVALQDTDNDGIPDAWEIAYGLNPTNAADALLDLDNDRVNNLGEFYAGTNPTNGLSYLKIARLLPYVTTNVPTLIQFIAYSNATYSVEYRNSLLPTANWQKLGDVNFAPSNRMVEVPDANAYKKSDRYYRVVAPATN